MMYGRRQMGATGRQAGWFVLALWVLAACNLGSQADPGAQATIDALAAENARLATAVATLQAAPQSSSDTAIASSPLVPASATAASNTTASTPVSSVQSGPVATPASAPSASASAAVVAQTPLAGDGQALVDLQIDQSANRLYITDAGGRLHVLDAATHTPLTTLPGWGMLTLDETRQRLYVAPSDLASATASAITVIDTQTLTVVTTISDATHLSLDTEHNRLFVGNRLYLSNEERAPGVRVLDANTLAVLAQGPQAGIPVYNPLRDELLVVAYTVFSADPATAQIRQDLLPEISEQPLRWCNGCWMATGAYVFPQANLLLLAVVQSATGGGAGLALPPRALDATTLAPLGDPLVAPPLQPTCGGRPLLQPAVDGRLFRWLTFSRYVVYNNLFVYDQAGSLLSWRDGLPPLYVDAASGRGYGNGWVIDLRTLNPLGRTAPFCVLGEEDNRGYIYTAQAGQLVVLDSATGGTAYAGDSAVVGVSGPLPAQPVDQILFSPNYGNDETLFVVGGGHELYRSTNSGQSWAALHGALNGGSDAPANTVRTLAISPNYGNDRTVFAGGFAGDGSGEGVWRSTDAGLSWQPVWTGLTHLRVRSLAVSPDFGEDQMVLTLSDYVRLDPWESGVSVHRSTDGGLTWLRTMTYTTEMAPPDANDLWARSAGEAALMPVRRADDGRAIEITLDGGATWQPVALEQQPPGALVLAVVPAPSVSPAVESAPTVYVLGDYGLWRVRMGQPETAVTGVVERWVDERLEGRDYQRKLTALAVSPVLNNGSHRLAVGTFAGELWLLDPAAMVWAATGAAPLVATTALTATPPVTATGAATTTAAPLTATAALTGPGVLSPALALTETGPLAGDPPDGLFHPEGMFASVWGSDPALQALLGWATTAEPLSINVADQTFEQGRMLWREDEQAIYVLYRDNTWEQFPDTFVEGQAEFDPSLTAPTNRLQPIRGFGKVWREQPVVRERVGWATAEEVGYTAAIHIFERGFLVRLGGLVYALGTDGSGRRVWRVV